MRPEARSGVSGAVTRHGRTAAAVIVSLALVASTPELSTADSREDAFLAGYTTAILERDFQLTDAAIEVKDGFVLVRLDHVQGPDKERIVSALSKIKGVRGVDVIDRDDPHPRTGSADRSPVVGADVSVDMPRFLPDGVIFDPLLADPRWPHFSIAYQGYLDDDELENVGATSFGETIPIYRDNGPWNGIWEIGLQAGVFAIFDLDAPSGDLVNADYLGGGTFAFRKANFSTSLRLFHQSSHLGDEFVLRETTERINLSFEQADALFSYDIFDVLRLYAGGGGLLRREPRDLDRWSTQTGAELEIPTGLAIRPVLAVDVQNRQESDWNTDFSGRAGFELEGFQLARRKFFLFAEYYDGRSPNGQFFDRRIEYVGVGGHLFF